MKPRPCYYLVTIWLILSLLDCYFSYTLFSSAGSYFKEVNPFVAPLLETYGEDIFIAFAVGACFIALWAYSQRWRWLSVIFLVLIILELHPVATGAVYLTWLP